MLISLLLEINSFVLRYSKCLKQIFIIEKSLQVSFFISLILNSQV